MLRFNDVLCGGEAGQFRANAEWIGWKSSSSGDSKTQPANSVRRAEWFEGSLRLLCVLEEGNSEVLALEGFSPKDFDALWRYFEQTCGVYLKRHRPVASLDEADFDGAMKNIEDGADRVDESAPGTVQKKAREADLMKKVENVRDGLDQAVSGDKQALSRVFAANGCERIGRLRLVVDTVELEVYHTDSRWRHLLSKCATIEAVLKELGTFRQWRPSEDSEHSSLLRRAMVQELRVKQGDEDEETPPAKTTPTYQAGAGYAQVEPPMPAPAPPQPSAHPLGQAQHEAKVSERDEDAKVNGKTPQEYEDEEVTDPNSVRASAPDDAGPGSNPEANRRLRYTHPNSIIEGWVWKRSRHLKRWRRRWLVLLPSELMSFKYRGNTEPTETVPAGTVMRIYSADGEVQQARCFCVVVRRRNYYMVCDDESQKRSWMQAIEKALFEKR